MTRRVRTTEWQKEREANRNRLITFSVNTHVPSKWRLLDLETGDIWRWEGGTFKLCHEGDGFATVRMSRRLRRRSRRPGSEGGGRR